MNNFWQRIPKPFYVLAPMEDVTDTVFRQVIAHCNCPDIYFTEFVNVGGLAFEQKNPELGQIVSHRLAKMDEKPLVAQIWGITPDDYLQSAKKIVELGGFAGIDINMGCPVKNVIKQGACSALIKNPNLASEIIKATQIGSQNLIPISVKTRIGFDKIETENWVSFLLKQNIQALTIHGRTVKEESKVPCHWDEIGKVVNLNNKFWQDKDKIFETKNNPDKVPFNKVLNTQSKDILQNQQNQQNEINWKIDNLEILLAEFLGNF